MCVAFSGHKTRMNILLCAVAIGRKLTLGMKWWNYRNLRSDIRLRSFLNPDCFLFGQKLHCGILCLLLLRGGHPKTGVCPEIISTAAVSSFRSWSSCMPCKNAYLCKNGKCWKQKRQSPVEEECWKPMSFLLVMLVFLPFFTTVSFQFMIKIKKLSTNYDQGQW